MDLFRRRPAESAYASINDSAAHSDPLLDERNVSVTYFEGSKGRSGAAETALEDTAALPAKRTLQAVDPLYHADAQADMDGDATMEVQLHATSSHDALHNGHAAAAAARAETSGVRPRTLTMTETEVKDPGRGRADIRALVSMPGDRAHKLAEERGNAELPPKVRLVLMTTAAIAFVLWIVMVAVVPELYLGWATLLTALFVMVAHEAALKLTRTPRVVNPGDAVFRVTDVVDFGLLFMFWYKRGRAGARVPVFFFFWVCVGASRRRTVHGPSFMCLCVCSCVHDARAC
jgi:hypothetical protein